MGLSLWGLTWGWWVWCTNKVEALATNLITETQLGIAGVFLALFLLMFWQHRQDSKIHKKEYKDSLDKMFEVVEKNTEANTKLSSAVDNLKDHIRVQNNIA